ncbi:MAG TPA: ABC transporter substrate-binding protein [Candidatus Acidoferrales bacterium]|nr:ABC transporter substrate-binding protein [Candidatus Acidoferrales bacterium]
MTFAPASSRQRIISLAPDVTSILIAIGARRQLVAVSRWCKEVADVGGLPEMGDCWAMDTGPILKLRPTMIIGSVPFKNETLQKILALPVPFLALNPRSLADIEGNIRVLGRIAGTGAKAEALVRKMRRKFEGVRRMAMKAKTRPRVYAEAWPNPRISSPPWVTELIEFAGGDMAVPAGQKISDEAVAQGRPDVIVLAWTATGDKAKPGEAFENPAWKGVPAVKNGKVVVVRDESLNTPGPPLMRGAEELLRAIHPELGDRSV